MNSRTYVVSHEILSRVKASLDIGIEHALDVSATIKKAAPSRIQLLAAKLIDDDVLTMERAADDIGEILSRKNLK